MDLALPTVPRPWKRRWLCGIVLLGVTVWLLYATRVPSLTLLARFLDVSEPGGPVDYALILGGGNDTRPFVAAALVKAGLARHVLVPTVKEAPDVEDQLLPAEHEIIKRVLAARGVPEQALIILPGVCASTEDEAMALARFLDQRPQSSVAVVTNTYHTRRASWVFRDVLGERFSGMRFVGVPTDGFNERNWWRFESGFALYWMEYIKLAFYWLRYRPYQACLVLAGLLGLVVVWRMWLVGRRKGWRLAAGR